MSEVRGSFEVSEVLFASGPWSVARAVAPDGSPVRLSMLELPSDLSASELSALVAALQQAASAPPAPSVAAVVGYGETEGRLWLAEAAPTGRSVRETVAASGPMAADQFIPVLHQVGAALEGLGAAGPRHGWLTPDNVCLEPAALVFGRAWSNVAAAFCAMRPGVVWPEAAYLAPEVARGGAADARSEAWSAAALAAFAVRGQAPERGLRAESLPPALAALAACLQDDPAARHPSVKALAVDMTVENAIAMQDAADQAAVPSDGEVPDWARALLDETLARREAGQPLVDAAPEPAAPPPPTPQGSRLPPPTSSANAPSRFARSDASAPSHAVALEGPPVRVPPAPRTVRRQEPVAAGFNWNADTEKRSKMPMVLIGLSVLFVLAAIALTVLR